VNHYSPEYKSQYHLKGGEDVMKKCKSCKSEIDSKASKCPHCGTDQRNWFMRHKIITVILVIIVIFGLIGAAGSKSGNQTSSGTSNTNIQTTEAKPTQAPMVVDATSLVGEYDKNKLSAQDKYTGKVVQTNGFIENISSDITGNYFLSLKPSNDQYYAGTTLQCFFADKSALTSLSKGQSVTVAGTMQDMSLGIVEMKDCSLVK
jgi:tRNA_anti-like